MYIKDTKLIEPMTKVFKAVQKGDTEKALQIMREAGVKFPEIELKAIQEFVSIMSSKKDDL